MTTSATAKVYAAVLRDIGKSKGSLDLLAEELTTFNGIVRDEKDFAVFLAMPGIDKERKKDFIRKVCAAHVGDDFINFLSVLVDNDRLGDLEEIENAFSVMIDEERNALRVTVSSSSPLDKELKVMVAESLSKKYKKQIILDEGIDPSLLGGIILKVGDTVIDGSLAKRLRTIHERLQQCSIEGDAVYEN
ncbi:MAG TPA: ATP synthase F1 subunit delta [Spirochaetota bacterium]